MPAQTYSRTFTTSAGHPVLVYLDFAPSDEEAHSVSCTIRFYLGEGAQADIKQTYEPSLDRDETPAERAHRYLSGLNEDIIADIYNKIIAPYFEEAEEGGDA